MGCVLWPEIARRGVILEILEVLKRFGDRICLDNHDDPTGSDGIRQRRDVEVKTRHSSRNGIDSVHSLSIRFSVHFIHAAHNPHLP